MRLYGSDGKEDRPRIEPFDKSSVKVFLFIIYKAIYLVYNVQFILL